MARIEAKNGYGYNLSLLDLNAIYEADNYVADGSVFQASYYGGSSDTFRGYGFTYNFIGEPTGGVITSYQAIRFGRVAFTVTGVEVSVPAIVAAAQTASTGDDFQLFRSTLEGADVMIGSTGNDTILSFGGNDDIRGGVGSDTLDAGGGDDRLTGGAGKDILFGRDGRDVFVFEKTSDTLTFARDTIRDFQRGLDKIDLRKIDADQDGTAGNQAFKFIGSKAFTGRDGELRFSKGVLTGDVDGDMVADFAIRVAGPTKLAATDFVL
ncbi:MAG TPA: M10 family metallopeptidase C-terminal domain-containing protein [Microvirga sp.]|jgi:serralysin